jgi:hypothetical protein
MNDIKELPENIENIEIGLTLPTADYDDMKAFGIAIDEAISDAKTDKKTQISLTLSLSSVAANAVKGIAQDTSDAEPIKNFVKDSKKLYPRDYQIRSDVLKGELSGDAFMAKLDNTLGLSGNTRCYLYGSGFSVKLGHIPEVAVIDLITNLTKRKLELGKSTNSIAFSNESVLYADIILDTFRRFATETTLDSEEWINYVAMEDIDLIAIYILKKIMPKGIDVIRTCNNVIKDLKTVDGTLTTKCDFSFSAKLDPLELIHYYPSEFTDKHTELLRRNHPNSISEKEAIEYRKNLRAGTPEEFDIGGGIVITLEYPSAIKHITQGKTWISTIDATTDEILDSLDTTDKLISETKLDVMKSMLLNKYVHLVKRIDIGDAFTEKDDDIFNALNRFISDEAKYKTLAGIFLSFIAKNRTTIIGIPNYECPKCRKEQVTEKTEEEESRGMIIPMNVYWSFLETCILKKKKMEEMIETT